MNWQAYLQLIPRRDFMLRFSRSSGPGGQNVNKVSTKATIKLDREKFATAAWLTPQLRQRILQSDFAYFTPKRDIIVSSELTRSQHANLDNCFEKLSKEIARVAFVPEGPSEETQKRWQLLAKREASRKKELKKMHASKKRDRKYTD